MPKGKPYAYDGATKKKGSVKKPAKKSAPAPKMPMRKPGMMRGY